MNTLDARKPTVMVTCPNGQGTAFDTRAEAEQYAEWGHACEAASAHRIHEAVAGGYFPVQCPGCAP